MRAHDRLNAAGIGSTARGLVASFAGTGPDDFEESFEAEPCWCGSATDTECHRCRLPLELCCCLEADEFDDIDIIGGALAPYGVD